MHTSSLLVALLSIAQASALSPASTGDGARLGRREEAAAATAAAAAVGPEAEARKKGAGGGPPGGWGPFGGGGAPAGGAGKCPPVWAAVVKDLQTQMVTGGKCNDFARAAIRASFHDCGSWKSSLGNGAGCDGSLYLAKEEIGREENKGLQKVIPMIGKLAEKHKVGVADMFQVAGAVGVKACPGGPVVQTYVGRKDRNTPNPQGLLPNARSPAKELLANMGDKGISPMELVALLGSHTAAKQAVFDVGKAGAALDNSVDVWDVAFYSGVVKNQAPFILPSDKALAVDPATALMWAGFGASQRAWTAAFSPAMTKMGLMGVERAGLVDCTALIAGGGGGIGAGGPGALGGALGEALGGALSGFKPPWAGKKGLQNITEPAGDVGDAAVSQANYNGPQAGGSNAEAGDSQSGGSPFGGSGEGGGAVQAGGGQKGGQSGAGYFNGASPRAAQSMAAVLVAAAVAAGLSLG